MTSILSPAMLTEQWIYSRDRGTVPVARDKVTFGGGWPGEEFVDWAVHGGGFLGWAFDVRTCQHWVHHFPDVFLAWKVRFASEYFLPDARRIPPWAR